MISAAILSAFALPEPTTCIQLTGGANNRVYRLNFLNRAPLVLKRYFQHPQDLRQRLTSEYSFLTYAWAMGLRCIPEPLACDFEANVALYSCLPGRSLTASDLNDSLIDQAIDFFLSLNQSKALASSLPNASEACFTLQEHLSLVEMRIERLASYQQPELEAFLQKNLLPAWESVKKRPPLSSDRTLSLEERCISPSDFGFHNALLQEDRLAFFDFEYAGWDDPAKTVCDFFCQPRIPIPHSYFDPVSHAFASISSHPKELLHRIVLLLPVYRIKWCCILLNLFSPVGQHRRTFAVSNEQKETQLHKAKQQLEAITWHT